MGKFLERYQSGEHEQVWDELVRYGDQIQERPLFDDALEVAYETMRRVRKNIEMMIPRLCAISYQFGYGWVQPFLGKQISQQAFSIVDQKREFSYNLDDRMSYMNMQEMILECPALFIPTNDNEEHALYIENLIQSLKNPSSGYAMSLRRKQEAYRKTLNAKALVKRLEESIGVLPLSVRAWYEIVGGVNFVGYHKKWDTIIMERMIELGKSVFDSGGYYLHPLAELDPLFIYPLTEKRIAFIEQNRQTNSQQEFFLELWPDETAKYLDPVRDYTQITVPCYTADTTIQGTWNGLTFVQYLRQCFQWGCFPGWQKQKGYPKEDINLLITGLIPF